MIAASSGRTRAQTGPISICRRPGCNPNFFINLPTNRISRHRLFTAATRRYADHCKYCKSDGTLLGHAASWSLWLGTDRFDRVSPRSILAVARNATSLKSAQHSLFSSSGRCLCSSLPGQPKDSNVSTSLASGKNNFPKTPSLYPKFSDLELLKQ